MDSPAEPHLQEEKRREEKKREILRIALSK
jgi:hypothetical protein